MNRALLLAASALTLSACTSNSPAPSALAAEPRPALGSFGVDTANMDTAVKPGDDFFRYANGKWLATFQMPADKGRYGSFDALGEKSERDVRTVLEELAARSPAPGTTPAKVGDMYASWMDEATIESRGVSPLKPFLDRIDAASDTGDVGAVDRLPDGFGPNISGGFIERIVADSTRRFADTARAAGIPVTYVARPQGSHTWGLFESEMQESWNTTIGPALGA